MMTLTLSFISLTIHLASIGHAKMPQQPLKTYTMSVSGKTITDNGKNLVCG